MEQKYVMRQVAALVEQAKALIAQAEALAESEGVYIDIGDLVTNSYRSVEDSWNGSNC